MLRSKELSLFDDNWRIRALSNGVRDLDGIGGIYFNTLRVWFQRFPVTNKQKRHLKQQLESLNSADHRGGANELSWWELMRLFQWSANPIPVSQGSLPDFHITSPYEFFCEVTTLNPSDYEKRKIVELDGLLLDHSRTISRVITKIVDDEKFEQIRYGYLQNKPSILLLFDSTIWGGLGTEFYQALADFLLGSTLGFTDLPVELSAIVYAECKVLPEGQIGISKQRSAVYHNPNAQYNLPETVFSLMHQYLPQHRELQLPPVESGSDYGLYWFLLSS